jgi:hypothetical protein
MSICGDQINSADNDGTFLNRFIRGDGTLCFLYDPQLKRQSATWKLLTSPRKKPRQDRPKDEVMLELFLDSAANGYYDILMEDADMCNCNTV